ncbi:N-alpha-acetyltransferase 20, partial [Ramicandelaber brevisporus]
MSTTRRFSPLDLLKFNNINLDSYTETYQTAYYFQYMCTWPDLLWVVEGPSQELQGYMIGKIEGEGELWHGHVTALTVAPDYRKLGLGRKLMDALERASDAKGGYFVDLFVRASNANAIKMYEILKYKVYRRVLSYYQGEKGRSEDAFDMRKSLSKDPLKKSMIPLPKPIRV